MITLTIVTIMIFLNISSFLEQNKEALVAGVLSGALVGVFSWIIHLARNTPPIFRISKIICHYSEPDNYFRIKVKNCSLSNLKIISANFIISYRPDIEGQTSKNDIVIATKKDDPLLFGFSKKFKIKNLRTFDTFIIDAQKCIDKETIAKKTSSNIQNIYQKGGLSLIDFFKEDECAILSAVFHVQNYRTGIERNYCQIFFKSDILSGRFESGRSLKLDRTENNPKGSDV